MFETVLDYLARTNLFNFIIFAGIIIYLFIKLDVIGMLQNGTEVVADKIDNSTAAKEEAEAQLQKIEDKVAHLKDEINDIIKQSETNANLVGEQILVDADKSAENIKNNTQKLIENKTDVVRNDILKRAASASIEVAREHIIKELVNNNDLHNKLIDESIEAIEGQI